MKRYFVNCIKNFISNEDGQGMIEYGLILALVAVVVIALLTTIGTTINSKYTDIVNALTK